MKAGMPLLLFLARFYRHSQVSSIVSGACPTVISSLLASCHRSTSEQASLSSSTSLNNFNNFLMCLTLDFLLFLWYYLLKMLHKYRRAGRCTGAYGAYMV